jgi:hypothetical protein
MNHATSTLLRVAFAAALFVWSPGPAAADETNNFELRPCTEQELCSAWGYLTDDCSSTGPQVCPAALHMCGVDELGRIHWTGICYDNSPDNCPAVIPCA